MIEDYLYIDGGEVSQEGYIDEEFFSNPSKSRDYFRHLALSCIVVLTHTSSKLIPFNRLLIILVPRFGGDPATLAS